MKAFPSAEKLSLLRNSQTPAKSAEFIYQESSGMELRDYFAAKAMQGMATWDIKTMDKLATDFGEEPLDYLARNAFAIADAMMKARENETR